ncbi:MAG: TetR family transcriptional regulator [Thalassolituus oleivorans]|uniref:TetR/AcrR family transcriptional regulator n=1 Tax=Thalassolituus oleivorans TaxID=187493 RepID=UPI001B416CD4|nr:TetR family transcriptional regulator [Thalassolituus oleivorans]MBQ0729013.1 TetR family transcriptional regulator [Thalassolituus oleivorans]MBQ0782155.1 TetR family transcriptional regulator [Thalassolituus oleivorans]
MTHPNGRQIANPSQRQIANREALLNAAEALFASYGYHAVPVRDITGLAKVRVAEVNDLFGGKEALFYEVIKRRAPIINAMRQEKLGAIRLDISTDEQLSAWIKAFSDPLNEKSQEGTGWRNYLRLVAQLTSSRAPILVSVVEFYNPIAMQFVSELLKLYPALPQATALRVHQFMVATCFSVFADNYRVNTLSQGQVTSSDFSASYNQALIFINAGAKAIIAGV